MEERREEEPVRISFLHLSRYRVAIRITQRVGGGGRRRQREEETTTGISKPAAPSNFDESRIFIEKFLQGGEKRWSVEFRAISFAKAPLDRALTDANAFSEKRGEAEGFARATFLFEYLLGAVPLKV